MVDTVNSSIAGGTTQTGVVPSPTTDESRAQLIENFDTFLELLVAQIQNQDPTDPVSTETFTQQLVQFSDLEQSIQSNDNLETILSSIESQNAANVVNYIGSTVTAQGAATTLLNGTATYNLETTEFIPEAEITIRDNLGVVVFQTTQSLQQGQNQFIWDGVGLNGQQFTDGGNFTLTAQGNNAEGNFSSISTAVSGVVDGVDFSGSTPTLRIGSISVPISAVTSVSRSL